MLGRRFAWVPLLLVLPGTAQGRESERGADGERA